MCKHSGAVVYVTVCWDCWNCHSIVGILEYVTVSLGFWLGCTGGSIVSHAELEVSGEKWWD